MNLRTSSARAEKNLGLELKQTAARCDDDTDWVFSMRFTLAVSVAKGPRASCEQF